MDLEQKLDLVLFEGYPCNENIFGLASKIGSAGVTILKYLVGVPLIGAGKLAFGAAGLGFEHLLGPFITGLGKVLQGENPFEAENAYEELIQDPNVPRDVKARAEELMKNPEMLRQVAAAPA